MMKFGDINNKYTRLHTKLPPTFGQASKRLLYVGDKFNAF